MITLALKFSSVPNGWQTISMIQASALSRAMKMCCCTTRATSQGPSTSIGTTISTIRSCVTTLALNSSPRYSAETASAPTTTVVFYGDKNNWWATYAFWVFQLFGHTNAKILNGGRAKWIAEGRELTRDKPSYPASTYPTPVRDDHKIRAFRSEVLDHIKAGKPLVDVRSPGEYKGELLHMADYPQEGALRGGHIPGARNVPWARAANADGTFKNVADLRAIYEQEQGLSAQDDVIAYCRIGERSSHSWFVLTYLLGFKNVRNYDGSWTEWGNAVQVPIER